MISSDAVTLAAPPVYVAEPTHALACFHRKWRVDHDAVTQARDEALDAFVATLTDEQHRLYRVFEEADGYLRISETDRFVDALAGHFPAFAPALRAVAYHVEESTEDRCCREAEAGRATTKQAAEQVVRHYIEQLLLLDAELHRALDSVSNDDYPEVLALLESLDEHASQAWVERNRTGFTTTA